MSVTTPFEDSGGTTWTTLAESETLVDELDALAPERVSSHVLGMSNRGLLPLWCVTVQGPQTPADAPSVLLVALQHGDEPAGREMALQTIRDLALTIDPARVDLLNRCRFHVIPAANPNGFPTDRAIPNTGGRNMNREHLSLAAVESRHVQQAITDLDPFFIWDAHEHYAPKGSRLRAEMLEGGHYSGDPTVNVLSAQLMAAAQARLNANGVPHGLYEPAGYDVTVLRSMASVRGKMFLLVETPARDDDVPRQTRVDWQCLIRDAILDWLTAHVDTAATEHDAAKARQAARTDPFDLTNGIVLNPAPAGYQVTGTPPIHLEVFGINHDAGQVPMGQAARGLIPYLLDPASPEPVVAATRIDPEPDPEPTGPTLRFTDGRPVTLMRSDGTPVTL